MAVQSFLPFNSLETHILADKLQLTGEHNSRVALVNGGQLSGEFRSPPPLEVKIENLFGADLYFNCIKWEVGGRLLI